MTCCTLYVCKQEINQFRRLAVQSMELLAQQGYRRKRKGHGKSI